MSHTRWDCKYHVVFIPKRRKKLIFGKLRKHIGEVLHDLANQKESVIVEGHLMLDHIHMCISIPPKYSVSNVVGFIKGKSAIAIARQLGRRKNFTGENFWARGYFVSTVGLDEEMVRALFIVAGVNNYGLGEDGKTVTREVGVVLFRCKWFGDWPFRDFHYDKTEGRWLGVGVIEDLFQIQERTNELANEKLQGNNFSKKEFPAA